MGNSASKAPVQDAATTAALFGARSLCDLQELLASGRVVDVNARNRDGETPLLMNVEKNDLELAKLLLERGADVNAVTAYHCAALHLAKTVNMVRLLVEHGANVNATDRERERRTPLFEAVRLGSAQTVQVLLDAGVDVTVRNKYGESVMSSLSTRTTVSILEMLIEHGASVDVYSMFKETPLYMAAREGSADLVQSMIDHGLSVHATSDTEGTPLHSAAFNGHLDLVKYLLDNNADIIDGDGSIKKTPLRGAAVQGQLDIMAELVARGASFMPNNDSDIPSETASKAASSALSPAAMVGLMIENWKKITSLRTIPLAWLSKMSKLSRTMPDIEAICEQVLRRLELTLHLMATGAIERSDKNNTELDLLILHVWKWMLECEEKTMAERTLASSLCREEVAAHHKAISDFLGAFRLSANDIADLYNY